MSVTDDWSFEFFFLFQSVAVTNCELFFVYSFFCDMYFSLLFSHLATDWKDHQ